MTDSVRHQIGDCTLHQQTVSQDFCISGHFQNDALVFSDQRQIVSYPIRFVSDRYVSNMTGF
ncbi:putative protein OS=Pseudomonas fragi OX=296 GN=NCTC10754_00286 PE=4 SV=1 [Pseudomonas fragi]|nr:hypothetical protein SAMN05216594_3833 [Pseudomonas fragi]